MRSRIITAAVIGFGLVGIPSFALAGRAPQQRVETRTVAHETVTRNVRPVVSLSNRPEARRDEHVVVERPVIRDVHRDVRIDEHVTVDHGRDWNRGQFDYIPAPVVVTTPVVVAPNYDTPIGLNQVPPVVLNAVAGQTGGAPIIGIDLIQNASGTFYDVLIGGAYNTQQTLRFAINGGFCGNM